MVSAQAIGLTQRRSVLGFLILLLIYALASCIAHFLLGESRDSLYLMLIGSLITAALLIAYWRGWESAPNLIVIVTTAYVILTEVQPLEAHHHSAILLFPPILALVISRPIWIVSSSLILLLCMVIWPLMNGIAADADALMLFSILSFGLIVARFTLESVHQSAQQAWAQTAKSAQDLEQLNLSLEQQIQARTTQLMARTEEQARLMEQQAQLLQELEIKQSTILALSVPVIPINHNTIIMPLIGNLDPERLEQIREQALKALERSRARRMLLDITGVSIIDTLAAEGIIAVVQAARLLGSEVAMVGVRPEVAQAIVSLGIDLHQIRSFGNLADALQQLAEV